MRAFLFSLCLGLAALAPAGTFEVFASVDRDRVELGESLQFRLGVKVDGQLDFPPQLHPPSFEGFEARGPQQSQNMSWVNGAIKMEQALTWELVAIKSGTLSLGPYTISAKTASAGEIVKKTPLIKVVVSKPKGLKFPGAMPQPQPTLDLSRLQGGPQESGELRDIKPDRPFPWHWVALGALAGLAAIFGLLTWWRHRPKGPPPMPVIRNPGQWALEQLEKARQELRPGDEAAFVLRAGTLLRDYLGQRLLRGPDLTLHEGLRLAARRAASLGDANPGPRLAVLIFSGAKVEPADADWAYEAVRAYVVLAERAWPVMDQAAEAPTARRRNKSRKP